MLIRLTDVRYGEYNKYDRWLMLICLVDVRYGRYNRYGKWLRFINVLNSIDGWY